MNFISYFVKVTFNRTLKYLDSIQSFSIMTVLKLVWGMMNVVGGLVLG